MAEDVKRRRYDNRGRAEAARRSRAAIVAAARDLLLERGYAGTTMADIAEAGGVSVETVYKAFGTKAALVKTVYDVGLAGDDDDVPIAQRPEMQALLADPDPEQKLRRYAAIARGMVERIGPLLAALGAGACSGDADLVELVETTDRERRIGAAAIVEHLGACGALPEGADRERLAAVVWTLIAPDVYRLLVLDSGFSHDEYEQWLGDALAAALLSPRAG